MNELIHDTIITEFRGDYPSNIPVRPGVNLDKLIEGDENPFFLALEISSEGRVSANGLIHDADFGNTLVQQIMSNATEGIMGHVKESDLSTAYPVSDVHWIGAKREGGKTWAKGYIPKTAAAQREHFRILLATGGKAATSVYGRTTQEFAEDKTSWRAKDFRLEQLDLAPYNRAALKPNSGHIVTAQMTIEIDKENDMTRDEVLAELTAKDIPASLREAIISEHTANNKQSQQLAELQQQLTDQRTLNETLQAQVKDNQVKEFATAVDGVVAEYVKLEAKSEQGKERVEALRRMYRARLVSELGDDREKLAEQAKALWESEFKVIAETIRDSLAGPAAIVGQRSNGSKSLEDTPENRARARAITGIGR